MELKGGSRRRVFPTDFWENSYNTQRQNNPVSFVLTFCPNFDFILMPVFGRNKGTKDNRNKLACFLLLYAFYSSPHNFKMSHFIWYLETKCLQSISFDCFIHAYAFLWTWQVCPFVRRMCICACVSAGCRISISLLQTELKQSCRLFSVFVSVFILAHTVPDLWWVHSEASVCLSHIYFWEAWKPRLRQSLLMPREEYFGCCFFIQACLWMPFRFCCTPY